MPRVSQCRNSEYGKVMHKAGFSKCEHYTAYWIWQSMPWQSSVLNMLGFWICKGFEYVSIIHGSRYATI